MKKLCSILCMIAMVIPLGIGVGAESFFKDVPEDHWANEAISHFYQAGILDGTGDGNFDPDGNVTREQFAKLLALVFQTTDYDSNVQTFSDVSYERWSYPYIEATKEYLTGYFPNDAQPFFNPNAKAVREDIAYALVKISPYRDMELKDPNIFDKFSDSDQISPALKDYVGIAMENNLILGDDEGKFRPQDGITRAETVTMLLRVLKMPVEPEPTASSEPTASPAPTESPVPTVSPSPKPSKAPDEEEPNEIGNYAKMIESDTILNFGGYEGNDVKGSLCLKWTPGTKKANFAAEISVRNPNEFSFMNTYRIESRQIIECTEDSVTGYFDAVLSDSTSGNKLVDNAKGTITGIGEDGGVLELAFDIPQERDISAADCKVVINPNYDEKLDPPEENTELKVGDHVNDEYFEDTSNKDYPNCIVMQTRKITADGVTNGMEIHKNNIFVAFDPADQRVHIGGTARISPINEDDMVFQIKAVKMQSVSESKITGSFDLVCNDVLIQKGIPGEITGLDGNLEDDVTIRLADGKWVFTGFIVEITSE